MLAYNLYVLLLAEGLKAIAFKRNLTLRRVNENLDMCTPDLFNFFRSFNYFNDASIWLIVNSSGRNMYPYVGRLMMKRHSYKILWQMRIAQQKKRHHVVYVQAQLIHAPRIEHPLRILK